MLEESKKRVSNTLKELAERKELQEDSIVSVALQAVYDQILLTLTEAKIVTDFHTFINVALIWALSELELFDHDFEQYFKTGLTITGLPEDFMLCSFTRTLSLFTFHQIIQRFLPLFSQQFSRFSNSMTIQS